MDVAILERNLKKGDKYRETLNETDKKVDGETATCVFNRVTQPQQSMFWNCRSEIRKGDSEKRQCLGKSSKRSKKEKTGTDFLLNSGLRRKTGPFKSSTIDKNARVGTKDRGETYRQYHQGDHHLPQIPKALFGIVSISSL